MGTFFISTLSPFILRGDLLKAAVSSMLMEGEMLIVTPQEAIQQTKMWDSCLLLKSTILFFDCAVLWVNKVVTIGWSYY